MATVIRPAPACNVGHHRQRVHHLRCEQLEGGPNDGEWILVCACCLEGHDHD